VNPVIFDRVKSPERFVHRYQFTNSDVVPTPNIFVIRSTAEKSAVLAALGGL